MKLHIPRSQMNGVTMCNRVVKLTAIVRPRQSATCKECVTAAHSRFVATGGQ